VLAKLLIVRQRIRGQACSYSLSHRLDRARQICEPLDTIARLADLIPEPGATRCISTAFRSRLVACVQLPGDTPLRCGCTLRGQLRRHLSVHVCPITAQFHDITT